VQDQGRLVNRFLVHELQEGKPLCYCTRLLENRKKSIIGAAMMGTLDKIHTLLTRLGWAGLWM
jgi:hypothetical protein